MSYVDPSRVEMALRYAEVARRPASERVTTTEDLRVFLAVLWADATPAARSRYTHAVARQPGELPWSAASLAADAPPESPGEPALHGPALVELIIGQAEPDDEGVPGYRLLVPGDARAEAILRGLTQWDADLLARVASPAGWRLEGAEEPEEPSVDETLESDPEGVEDSPSEGSTGTVPTPPSNGRKMWAAAGVALGLVGLGYVASKVG